MEEDFELEYDIQEVRLSQDLVYKVTTVANEALPLEMLLQLETRREEISGQRLWEGSLLLCAHLLEVCRATDSGDERRNALSLRDKAVLELGAGTGVVSMLAHGLGALPVAVTDGDDRCVVMADKSMGENGIRPEEAFVAVLRWGDDDSTSAFCKKYAQWRAATRQGLHSGSDGEHACRPIGEAHLRPAGKSGQMSNRMEEADIHERHTKAPIVNGSAEGGLAPASDQPTSDVHEDAFSPGRSFDFVLAGDVLYKHSLLSPFLKTVDEMLATGGRLLLCHVPRAGVTYDIVEEMLDRSGFAFEILSGDKGQEEVNGGRGDVGGVELCVDDARRARLYSITRK